MKDMLIARNMKRYGTECKPLNPSQKEQVRNSDKYQSVSQCVLQTMIERKLTGNEMFKLVKEEYERILGKVKSKREE